MLDFKTETSASIMFSAIELIHMMRKQQGVFPAAKALSIKQQCDALSA